MENELIKIAGALLIALVGFLLGREKYWKENRQEVSMEVWKERCEVYKELMNIMGILPKWPSRKEEADYADLLKLTTSLRDWYFTESGGLFLSDESRDKYFKVQEAIKRILEGKPGDEKSMAQKLAGEGQDDYEYVRKLLSRLRSELTADLLSRRRNFLKKR